MIWKMAAALAFRKCEEQLLNFIIIFIYRLKAFLHNKLSSSYVSTAMVYKVLMQHAKKLCHYMPWRQSSRYIVKALSCCTPSQVRPGQRPFWVKCLWLSWVIQDECHDHIWTRTALFPPNPFQFTVYHLITIRLNDRTESRTERRLSSTCKRYSSVLLNGCPGGHFLETEHVQFLVYHSYHHKALVSHSAANSLICYFALS
jgi:hypothetical protein